MTDIPSHENSILPCSTIAYRALLYEDWYDENNKKVASAAFLRRPRDKDGISVFLKHLISMPEVTEDFNPCLGIATIHLGRVRDIGLDIAPSVKAHTAITGVPFPKENRVLMERLAGQLAKQARIVWLMGEAFPENQ